MFVHAVAGFTNKSLRGLVAGLLGRDDTEVVRRIGELADEERALEGGHTGEVLSGSDLERLRAIELAIDQCRDLLRQRRARRNAGEDPDQAAIRPEGTVEGYRQ